MRRETAVLLIDGEPAGGECNDDENREFPTEYQDAPPLPDIRHDDLTETTADWVAETFDTWGTGGVRPAGDASGTFATLGHFVDERLPDFGR